MNTEEVHQKVKPQWFNIFFFISLVLTATVIYLLFFRDNLPIKYYVCGKGYVDCHLTARFDDLVSCESAEQKAGWYCNSEDKSRIICEEKESDFVDSYCSE